MRASTEYNKRVLRRRVPAAEVERLRGTYEEQLTNLRRKVEGQGGDVKTERRNEQIGHLEKLIKALDNPPSRNGSKEGLR
jgi:hypothetical protein